MGKRSREKGAQGERDAAKLLQGLGIQSHRGQQFSGLEGEDVVCTSLSGVHWEVKRAERFDLYPSLAQSERDATVEQIPAVLHRKNRKPWVVIVQADQMVKFARAILRAIEEDRFFS